MKILKAKFEIMTPLDREDILKRIEKAGRTCYKSEDRITEESASKFVKGLVNSGHMSVIEHAGMTVKFIVDRGITHEAVRHRLASFSQESTRYCNYSQGKFGNELSVIDIRPHVKFDENFGSVMQIWYEAMENAERSYNDLIELGVTPQIARGVLPNSLKAELVITSNFRNWLLILKQRTSKAAHPQIREVMLPLLQHMAEVLPEIYGNLYEQRVEEGLYEC